MVKRSLEQKLTFHCTVKPVHKDHSRDQVIMVFVDRWSLCRGAIVLF